MRDGEGRIVVVDWKRSKCIRMENERASLKHPLGLPETNYWLYSRGKMDSLFTNDHGSHRASPKPAPGTRCNLICTPTSSRQSMACAWEGTTWQSCILTLPGPVSSVAHGWMQRCAQSTPSKSSVAGLLLACLEQPHLLSFSEPRENVFFVLRTPSHGCVAIWLTYHSLFYIV